MNFNIDIFKNIGKGLISLTGQLEYNANVLERVSITEPESTNEAEKITSEKYDINEEEKYISKIAPKTTVAQFKENVTTKQALVFTDKEGNILNDNDILGTGMKVKVGETLEYTLIVIRDIDGDGEITINDLAQMKLVIIGLFEIE